MDKNKNNEKNEQRKNAAVEKVDEIIAENELKKVTTDQPFTDATSVKKDAKPASKKQTIKKKKPADKAKNKVITDEKQRTEKAEAKLKERKAKKAAKVKAAKQRREEKARYAEEKRNAAKTAKAAKIKKAKAAKVAKRRKAESVKALKIQKREERLAKKQALKHESKEDRQKRIAAEKQAKLKIRADKAEKAAELKAQKAERKAEKNRVKAERKAEKARAVASKKAENAKAKNARKSQRQKNKRGVGGWIAAVVSLGCAVLVLGSLLAVRLIGFNGEHPAINASQNSARNFYDFVGYVDGIETDMSKIFVSTDNGGKQRLLQELSVKSNLADSALSQIPLTDESKYYTSKYINQVGDYAKYLNNRLIAGEKLTKEDEENLQKLYEITVELKSALSTLSASIGENYDFKNLTENNANDLIVKSFNDLERSAADYPQMIYDGPFSDGLEAIEAKGVSGEEISAKRAEENFRRDFENYKIEKVEVTGEIQNVKIDCYNVLGKTEEGGDVYAQYTIKGGKLLSFLAHKNCAGEEITEDDAEKRAEEFLTTMGLKNMTRVWRYTSGGVEYFNYAYTKNGCVVYPDLVKLTVCRETGIVTGMSAEEYYLNHTERGKFAAKYTMEQAEDKANDTLTVTARRKAIVPIGNGKETCAYEFAGTYAGDEYYVFLDANTLKEIKIYKVVETEEGRLLV